MQQRELMFDAAADPSQVVAALSPRYRLHAEPATRGRWTCLDTADWRLHRASMTLRDTRRGRARALVLSATDGDPITVPSTVTVWPRRVEMLPDSPVRDRLALAVGVRALLPLAEVSVHSLLLSVLDEQEKTRVRIEVNQQRLVGGSPVPLPLRVVVSPLRGYERDAHRCAAMLADSMTSLPGEQTAASVAMAAAGHRPGELTLAPLRLNANDPAVTSLARVLRRWMDVIDTARPGVLADVDIEYLHEMRTAVRATRSMLALAGDILSGTQVEQFAAEFAWLGRLTAPVRDLDVSLLELDGRGELDVSGLDGLDQLRQHLQRQRQSALRNLRAGLRSPRGAEIGIQWRRALNRVETPQLAGPTALAIAGAQAQEAYRHIAKAAAPVDAQTPANDLHRLRRRCKRMRYLLDGYASLYPPGPHGEVLLALKKLQDCLGDIQDVDVQSAYLSSLATTLVRSGGSADVILAMGALRERARQRDAAARMRLASQLQRFCGSETRGRVQALALQPEACPA